MFPMLVAAPFVMSCALFILSGWEILLSPPHLPIHDEGAIDHLGMILAFGQVPVILLGFVLRVREPGAAFRQAARQAAALAAALGLVTLDDVRNHQRVLARIHESRPFPQGEQAVLAFLAHGEAAPHADDALRDFSNRIGPEIGRLGAVRSVGFDGVDGIGWDIYAVMFERGARHIHLYLDGDSHVLGIALVDGSSGCLASEAYECRDLHHPLS